MEEVSPYARKVRVPSHQGSSRVQILPTTKSTAVPGVLPSHCLVDGACSKVWIHSGHTLRSMSIIRQREGRRVHSSCRKHSILPG